KGGLSAAASVAVWPGCGTVRGSGGAGCRARRGAGLVAAGFGRRRGHPPARGPGGGPFCGAGQGPGRGAPGGVLGGGELRGGGGAGGLGAGGAAIGVVVGAVLLALGEAGLPGVAVGGRGRAALVGGLVGLGAGGVFDAALRWGPSLRVDLLSLLLIASSAVL